MIYSVTAYQRNRGRARARLQKNRARVTNERDPRQSAPHVRDTGDTDEKVKERLRDWSSPPSGRVHRKIETRAKPTR